MISARPSEALEQLLRAIERAESDGAAKHLALVGFGRRRGRKIARALRGRGGPSIARLFTAIDGSEGAINQAAESLRTEEERRAIRAHAAAVELEQRGLIPREER